MDKHIQIIQRKNIDVGKLSPKTQRALKSYDDIKKGENLIQKKKQKLNQKYERTQKTIDKYSDLDDVILDGIAEYLHSQNNDNGDLHNTDENILSQEPLLSNDDNIGHQQEEIENQEDGVPPVEVKKSKGLLSNWWE